MSTSIPTSIPIARPVNRYQTYHAHVYFDEATRDPATRLCTDAAAMHGVQMGRVHSKLVGPHPRWSCQLSFGRALYDSVIPWLDAHRDGLTVLVHGMSDDPLKDHTEHASWLGEPVALNLGMFGGR